MKAERKKEVFSDNLKISSRQLKRILVLDWLGKLSLIIPGIAVLDAGRRGIVSILLGLAGILLYVCMICMINRNLRIDIFQYVEEKMGRFGIWAIGLIYLCFVIVNTAFTTRLMAEIVRRYMLPETSIAWIILLFLLVCGYGATGNIEGRGRTSEVVFKIILIPMILMLCLLVPDLRTDYLMQNAAVDSRSIMNAGYAVFAVFSEVGIILFMAPYIHNKERMQAKTLQAVGITGGFLTAIFITSIGMFGTNSMRSLSWPVIALMSSVNVPGGFLERWDILFLTLLLFSIFVAVSGGVFYSAAIMKKLIEKKHVFHYIVPGMIVTYLAAVCFTEYEKALAFYLSILKYFFTPVTVFIGVLLWILVMLDGRKHKDE